MNTATTTAGNFVAQSQQPLPTKLIPSANQQALPPSFVPCPNEIICGRGSRVFANAGNQSFREVVKRFLPAYAKSKSKVEKSYIIADVVAAVRAKTPYGGFVKRNAKEGRWYEVGEFLAREKTSQCFRDMLCGSYKSSSSAKKQRRAANYKRSRPQSPPLKTELTETITKAADDDIPTEICFPVKTSSASRQESLQRGGSARSVMDPGPFIPLDESTCLDSSTPPNEECWFGNDARPLDSEPLMESEDFEPLSADEPDNMPSYKAEYEAFVSELFPDEHQAMTAGEETSSILDQHTVVFGRELNLIFQEIPNLLA